MALYLGTLARARGLQQETFIKCLGMGCPISRPRGSRRHSFTGNFHPSPPWFDSRQTKTKKEDKKRKTKLFSSW